MIRSDYSYRFLVQKRIGQHAACRPGVENLVSAFLKFIAWGEVRRSKECERITIVLDLGAHELPNVV